MSNTNPKLLRDIEELRQRLHEALGEGYDPARLQEARDISSQLDALIVEATRKRSDDQQPS